MTDTRLSRYRLLDQIGAGAMGVVYRGRDLNLEREVAVKVLTPGLLGDEPARRRFRQEALALSRLNHPNIATVFDFVTEAGSDMLVMELVEGRTLDQVLAQGPLAAAKLHAFALQVAEALDYAHQRGVVHRDLKPANLGVTPDGRLKILDFGLARWRDNVTPTATLTQAGAAVGTLAYMAPESLGGERGDERSDLYSLGVVLYEMATGSRPHQAESAIGLMFAILNYAPRPPRELNPSLPAAFERIVLGLLERDPHRRPDSAAEVAALLRGESGTASPAEPHQSREGPRIRSLAVLPLDNLSGDAAQEFFADGMTEALISDLARLPGLRVISRTSVMRYKGARRAVPEIAAELNVEAVLEGSVLRAGERVRVTAQLIDARSDTHLWAERYDRDARDVLELQSDVARAIAHEIHVALSPQAAARLAGAGQIDPAAHDAYLRGRYQLNRRTEESLRRAVEHFQAAIERVPGYALAHVGLSETFNVQGYHDFVAPTACFPRARAAALRALELDPALGEAHSSLAYAMLFHDWDRPGAEQEFRRALELNPGYALGHVWWVNLLLSRGRFDEAIVECRRARDLDPLSLVAAGVMGWTLLFAREYERAVREMEQALELDPDFVFVRVWRAWSYWLMGRPEPAAAEFEHAARVSTHPPLRLVLETEARIARGRPDEAREKLRELEGMRAERYVSAVRFAYVNVQLGEYDRALDWLETAIQDRAPWIVMMDTDPRLDPLRGHPRFGLLRRQAGFE